MANKEELSKEVNEILGTDFDFTGMKKDELESLMNKLDRGATLESQGKHIASEYGKEALDSAIEDWEPGKLLMKKLL